MNAPPSLCPGYRQVEAFGPDEDYESEEEVFYVTLDMGNVEPTLVPSSTSYRLIGLDTPTPYIQLQGTILKGRHDMLLGTELIFTDDKDHHDWNTRSVVHVGNTEQRIAFQELTLVPKSKADVVMDPAQNPFQPAADDRPSHIDRMTGVTAPIPRAPRTRKEASSSKGKRKAKAAKPKGKGKEKATTHEEDMESMIVMDDEDMDVE
ncbi:hypothetical protein CPC08DRAFT_175486 [Agrocybe pediades]|nr:hypothetical protein CPC08DRAFT_175486 [Agrocybe pediades]